MAQFQNLDCPSQTWTPIPGSDAGLALIIRSRNNGCCVQFGTAAPPDRSVGRTLFKPGVLLSGHRQMSLANLTAGEFVWIQPDHVDDNAQIEYTGSGAVLVGSFSSDFSSDFF